MPARRIPILVHLLGAAIASAIAADWLLRLVAPAPAIVPPPAPAVAVREPDATLAARMFGDVNSGPVAASLNVQVDGVFAAGPDSSAVIAVDGKPSRAVLIGQDVVSGTRLVEVRPDGVTLEHGGARTQYAVPLPSIAASSAPTASFSREGNTLTAPSQDTVTAKGPTTGRPLVHSTPSGAFAVAPPAPPAPPGSRGAPEEAQTQAPGHVPPMSPNGPFPPGPGSSPGG